MDLRETGEQRVEQRKSLRKMLDECTQQLRVTVATDAAKDDLEVKVEGGHDPGAGFCEDVAEAVEAVGTDYGAIEKLERQAIERWQHLFELIVDELDDNTRFQAETDAQLARLDKEKTARQRRAGPLTRESVEQAEGGLEISAVAC